MLLERNVRSFSKGPNVGDLSPYVDVMVPCSAAAALQSSWTLGERYKKLIKYRLRLVSASPCYMSRHVEKPDVE